MRRLAITGLLMGVTLICIAQASVTKYYKSLPVEEEVSREKAKYSKTITQNPDGSITTERKNLKKDLVESREAFKGDEPVGIWIYLRGAGSAELDYNFTLEYSNQDCVGDLHVKNWYENDATIQYVAPKISDGQSFSEFTGRNMVYPAKARRAGIQGKVDLIFDITKDGSIENIRVRRGVDISLDKEAVRVLRKLKLSNPPLINGQPQTLCFTTSLSFQLM